MSTRTYWIITAKHRKEEGDFYWTGGVTKSLPLFSLNKIEAYPYQSKEWATKNMDRMKEEKVFADLYDFQLIPA